VGVINYDKWILNLNGINEWFPESLKTL